MSEKTIAYQIRLVAKRARRRATRAAKERRFSERLRWANLGARLEDEASRAHAIETAEKQKQEVA